jgi:D-alanyl-D-alanine carboxypeptidase
MQELHAPGAIVFVDVPEQGASWTTALGTGDLSTGAPVPLDGYVRIGSITKTLTATVILQLVDEGKLRLEEPVNRYLSEVPNGENITMRQLLNMTSGLFDNTEDLGFAQTLDEDPHKVWDPQEVLNIAFKHEPYFAPGEGYHYSNTNYILLGLIAEQITGMPLGEALQERIFTPLGMTNTSLPELYSAAIPEPHPQGYLYGTNVDGLEAILTAQAGHPQDAKVNVAEDTQPNDVTDWNPSHAWAAGSGISTLEDLKIWAKELATGSTLLSEEIQKERLSFTPARPYGLGVGQIFGGLIGANGAIAGYQSFVGYQPEKSATIVVLVNSKVAPNVGIAQSRPADELAKVIQEQLLPSGSSTSEDYFRANKS